MSGKPALKPGRAVGEAIVAVAHDILVEARTAIDDPTNTDAVAVHDFRKAMKRWRALLRLIEPFLGQDGHRLRMEARDLARDLAGTRDMQAALDALADLQKTDTTLSDRTFVTMRGRIETIKAGAEAATLTETMRERLRAGLDAANRAVQNWPLGDLDFKDIAEQLAEGYRRARDKVPEDWSHTEAESLHELRARAVVHRYQMELVEPLWPRLTKLWVAEAQRLRERLGSYQDLVVLSGLTAPHAPLAPWRSRLAAAIAERQAAHARAAARIVGRLLAERPKAFRQRLEALWEHREDEYENGKVPTADQSADADEGDAPDLPAAPVKTTARSSQAAAVRRTPIRR